MRKTRTLTAVLAVAGLGLVASPAMAANKYTIDGSGPTGGTPSKPKAAKLQASWTVENVLGANLIPDVVATYRIAIEGGRLYKPVLQKLPKCAIPAEGQEQTADQCPSGSIIGKGTLEAAVGKPGEPIVKPTFYCTLPYNIYNPGDGNLGVFIKATSQQCPVAVAQWIKMKVTQKGLTTISEFTVPEKLQNPLKDVLYSGVTTANFTFSPKFAKIKGKRVPSTQAIGCGKKKTRRVTVDFITAAGAKVSAFKSLPC